jgi:ribosomal protein S21
MAKTALIKVVVKNGDIAKALKVFKKKVNDSGHLLELRERKEFTKPKTVRRTIKLKAIRENQRRVMLDRMASGEYNSGKKNKK